MFGTLKFAVACFSVMLLTLASSAAAPAEIRSPSLSFTALSIDSREQAARLHGYIQVSVTDYETAGTNFDDIAASCHPTAPDLPSGSVWFRFSVPAGTLMFSTDGSSVVSSDPNGAHLLALYRENSGTLTEAACITGTSSAAAAWNGLRLRAGEYYAVYGMPDGVAASSGSLLVTMDYAPDAPVSNDDFAKAKRLKFPANPTAVSLHNATYEPNEVISSCATSQRPSNSIWYRFSLDHTSALDAMVVFAQATGSSVATTSNIIITLFKATPSGLVEVKCSTGDANPRADGLLKPGKYYIRLEIDRMGGFGQSGIVQMILSASIGKGSPYFTDIDTMTADMTGWKVTKGSAEDAIECTDYSCGFVLHSSGASEATVLTTNASLTNVKLKKGDQLALAVLYGAETTPNARALVIVTFKNGRAPLRFGAVLNQTGPMTIVNATRLLPSGSIGAIKVKIKNKDKSAGSKLSLGAVIVSVLRLGEMHQRWTLPVPPPAQ